MFEYERVPIAIDKGGEYRSIQDYLIFTGHQASEVTAGWICWICRCATIGASVVGVELEFELHIVLGLPDHPHEET